MLLYGASGHAKVICSSLESQTIPVCGIFDDNPELTFLDQYKVLGSYDPGYLSDELMLVSIGDNRIRKKIAESILHRFGNCIAASAVCDSRVEIGEGTVILQKSVIQRDTMIGKHCIINTSASVDHDCVIDNYVHISPGATLCGSVYVGEGTHIGAGATVIQNIKIGKWCVIGAGTVVVDDIPDYSVVVGVPGRIKRKIRIDE